MIQQKQRKPDAELSSSTGTILIVMLQSAKILNYVNNY